MWFSLVLSAALLVPLTLQLQLEASRTEVSQLDRTNVEFVPIDQCDSIAALEGLEVLPELHLTETQFGTTVVIEVINHGRLVGTREIWAKVYSPRGKLREGMKIWLKLEPAGRNHLEFFFTGTADELRESKISLGF